MSGGNPRFIHNAAHELNTRSDGCPGCIKHSFPMNHPLRMHILDKPTSQACERNREPILAVLREYFRDRSAVLEIGSGTGQHAVHFAAALPYLKWQTSDRAEYLRGITMWLDEAGLINTPPPLELDVNLNWPPQSFDAIFSANTLHIMSWLEVERLFAHLPDVMTQSARLVIYGPFNYAGQYTSYSNARFDGMLKEQATHQGLRDSEAVIAVADRVGFRLLEDRAMPANNRCLIWERSLQTE